MATDFPPNIAVKQYAVDIMHFWFEVGVISFSFLRVWLYSEYWMSKYKIFYPRKH